MTTMMDKALALLAERVSEDLEQRDMKSLRYGNTQFQPSGEVLQLSNWKPGDRMLKMSNFVRLTWKPGMASDGPGKTPSKVTLEESLLERHQDQVSQRLERHSLPNNTIAEIPFIALAERERQELELRNSTLASGAAARPLDPTVLGDAGLILARYAPILARMNVMMGVVGDQRLATLTAQDAPVPIAEGGAIPAGTWTFGGDAKLPKTIPAAFQMTSSLRAIDDAMFEAIVRSAIRDVLQNKCVQQVLTGDGVGTNLSGAWTATGVPETSYGASDDDFDRSDMLAVLNSCRLANTDGSAPLVVASKGLWELLEKTPRAIQTFGPGTTSGGGITDVQRFLLDDVMHSNAGVMGYVEGAECHYYSDLAPDAVVNPGLVFKGDRAVVWFWGDSLSLEYVPQTSANYFFKLCAEINADFELPAKNFAKIRQT